VHAAECLAAIQKKDDIIAMLAKVDKASLRPHDAIRAAFLLKYAGDANGAERLCKQVENAVYKTKGDMKRNQGTQAQAAKLGDARALFKNAKLKDGRYRGTAPSFWGPLHVVVTVAQGKIASIAVEHGDDRPAAAPKAVADRIIARQMVPVDAVTGATVTSLAVELATLDALKSFL